MSLTHFLRVQSAQAISDLGQEQEFYGEQPGVDFDYSQYLAESIPQLQAQLSQINVMLNNPSLPMAVRKQTEIKHLELQSELERAQLTATLIQANNAVAAANAMQFANAQQQMQQQQQQQHQQQQTWTNPYTSQQPGGAESAYQRLPLNNRRRNLKRERPSDFLEVAGSENDAKVPRYWE